MVNKTILIGFVLLFIYVINIQLSTIVAIAALLGGGILIMFGVLLDLVNDAEK